MLLEKINLARLFIKNVRRTGHFGKKVIIGDDTIVSIQKSEKHLLVTLRVSKNKWIECSNKMPKPLSLASF
jgi:hypothetical protein